MAAREQRLGYTTGGTLPSRGDRYGWRELQALHLIVKMRIFSADRHNRPSVSGLDGVHRRLFPLHTASVEAPIG